MGLRARLAEAEATLEAIRSGEVDALVVAGPGGEQTRAIEGATHPYHVLLNAMNDGAALLLPDGTMLFANRRLGEIARAPLERLRGSRFQQLVAAGERASFEELVRAERSGGGGGAPLGGGGGPARRWVGVSPVPVPGGPGGG